MDYLLDTNAWIAFLQDAPDLSVMAAERIEDEQNACWISTASLWEAAIKVGIGKLQLPYDLRKDLPGILEGNGLQLLPVSAASALAVRDLPSIHRDPFDRIQVCQAVESGLQIISRDGVFESYGLTRIW